MLNPNRMLSLMLRLSTRPMLTMSSIASTSWPSVLDTPSPHSHSRACGNATSAPILSIHHTNTASASQSALAGSSRARALTGDAAGLGGRVPRPPVRGDVQPPPRALAHLLQHIGRRQACTGRLTRCGGDRFLSIALRLAASFSRSAATCVACTRNLIAHLHVCSEIT